MTSALAFIYGLLTATAVIFIYDWISGYPASDAVKDFAVRLFGSARTMAEARVSRLEAKAQALKANLKARL